MKYITLKAKVANPKADRRRKFDWRSEVAFKRGKAFTVNEKAKVLHPADDANSAIPLDDVRARLILQNAEDTKAPKVEHLMIAHDINSGKLLSRLIRKGKVTVEDIQEVLPK